MTEAREQSTKQLEFDRINTLLATPLTTLDGNSLGADELWARAFSSPFGNYMDGQPLRFSQDFGYEPTEMIKDLGLDVRPLDHQVVTGKFVAYIFDRDALKPEGPLAGIATEARGIVMLAALIHDMGETMHPDILDEVGQVVGDIPYGRKTDAHRVIEAAVRSALYRHLYPDLPEETLERIEAIISHQDHTVLHDIYEAAHDLQTLDTAMRASKKSWGRWNNEPHDDYITGEHKDKYSALSSLANSVMLNTYPRCREWAGTFSFAAEYIDQNYAVISRYDRSLQPEYRRIPA